MRHVDSHQLVDHADDIPCSRYSRLGLVLNWPPQRITLCPGSRPTCLTSGWRRDFARMSLMASYSVNEEAVAQARRLIDAHQYVLDSVELNGAGGEPNTMASLTLAARV